MDKLTNYRLIIKKILTEYAELLKNQPVPGMDTELVFDEERDHYMLYNVGWPAEGPVSEATIYVRIRNGKFRIEEDWTEEGVANLLLEAGVPKADIVLAFHPPEIRPHTEFATA
ncbi:MAG: XisI protein [Chloroflexi bacterium]|nr:XisI protein [Ardenticatenaceae bacterium]MBL1128038.1 XisI protein [Chloroflexota bacterium]NOG34110.1 XisI protein [Chloroflexota bacterium]GIK56891.1 MAG: hypothetical protein BroJett015_25540 [Chloroflexota bacterium]